MAYVATTTANLKMTLNVDLDVHELLEIWYNVFYLVYVAVNIHAFVILVVNNIGTYSIYDLCGIYNLDTMTLYSALDV